MAIDKTKPRVCVYYHVLASTGHRDDGAPLFLNLNLRKILNGNGKLSDHSGNVVHLAPWNFDGFGKFDLNILVDHGEDVLGVPLDFELPHPSAYWISDAHLGIGQKGVGYDYRMNRAKQFDFVFVAQKAFIEPLVRDGIPRERIFYLPHAFEPDVYRPISTINKWDWVFVGHPNSEHRIQLLDRFIKEFPKDYYLGWRIPGNNEYNGLDDVNMKYNQSKLVINDAVNLDLNLRVFEALGAGRCLLTQDIPEFDGEVGDAFVTYKSLDEAVEKARELLKDDERRERIAKAGHAAAMREHTFGHRALSMLDICLGYKPAQLQPLQGEK